jgi:hypothetical protein
VTHAPSRRRGLPGDEPTTGFLNSRLMKPAASCSRVPPISPIMITASVSGSAANSVSASMKLVPISGSPPMPMHVVCPCPARELVNRLVGQRAALRDDADAPFLQMWPG